MFYLDEYPGGNSGYSAFAHEIVRGTREFPRGSIEWTILRLGGIGRVILDEEVIEAGA